MSQPQGHSAAGRIMSMKNSNDTIGNRNVFMVWCIIRHTENLWGGASPSQVQNVWFIVVRSTSQMNYAGCPTIQIILSLNQQWHTQWHSWLRHHATSHKVAGLIPNGVTGIFHWHNPSSHTMALGLTQPPTEMSTRNISWGVKAASAWGWQPYHLHLPIVWKSGSLYLLEPSGPVQACNGMALSSLSPSPSP